MENNNPVIVRQIEKKALTQDLAVAIIYLDKNGCKWSGQ